MPRDRASLLAGRNVAPLDDEAVRRGANTFLGLDDTVSVRYEAGGRTRFISPIAEGETAEIVFGPDLYPGAGVVDPNSSLSAQAAAAHEICHYHRWANKTELALDELDPIDEALTSLEAIMRFPKELSQHEVRQLVADAIQRLQIYAQSVIERAKGAGEG